MVLRIGFGANVISFCVCSCCFSLGGQFCWRAPGAWMRAESRACFSSLLLLLESGILSAVVARISCLLHEASGVVVSIVCSLFWCTWSICGPWFRLTRSLIFPGSSNSVFLSACWTAPMEGPMRFVCLFAADWVRREYDRRLLQVIDRRLCAGLLPLTWRSGPATQAG